MIIIIVFATAPFQPMFLIITKFSLYCSLNSKEPISFLLIYILELFCFPLVHYCILLFKLDTPTDGHNDLNHAQTNQSGKVMKGMLQEDLKGYFENRKKGCIRKSSSLIQTVVRLAVISVKSLPFLPILNQFSS